VKDIIDAPAPAAGDKYPGICDFHVHVGERIGGYELRDGFLELDRMAARYGICAVGAFVSEEPGISLQTKLEWMQTAAKDGFRGHVHWHLTPVTATIEEVYPLLEDGCDLKLYTTYRNAGLYSSYERIGQWMELLSDIRSRILVHCEDDAIIAKYSSAHPFRNPLDHALRRPEIAEITAVDKVLNLAVKHSHPVHIVHVSSPKAALLIGDARKHNPDITCETAPHYLLKNEDCLAGANAHRLICTPPFRSESSRGTLVEMLQDGFFDIVASDHCAFRPEDKDRYNDHPEKVPCGIEGIPAMFPSLYNRLVLSGKLSLEQLIDLCAIAPARLMGIAVDSKHSLSDLLGGNSI